MELTKAIQQLIPSDAEIIIYNLLESGLSSRETARRTCIGRGTVVNMHKSAEAKISRLAEAGLLQTDIAVEK